jgi:hypothetical protein
MGIFNYYKKEYEKLVQAGRALPRDKPAPAQRSVTNQLLKQRRLSRIITNRC